MIQIIPNLLTPCIFSGIVIVQPLYIVANKQNGGRLWTALRK